MQPILSSDQELLESLLKRANKDERDLKNVCEQLSTLTSDINQIVGQTGKLWAEHREKFFNNLVEELKKHNISLTVEEQNMLRYSTSTATAATTAKKDLEEKHKIKLSEKATDFTIAAYEATIAALRRNLHKPEEAHAIIKAVKEVIESEEKATRQFREEFKGQVEKKTATIIKDAKTTLETTSGLSPEQENQVEEIARHIKPIEPQAPPEFISC